MTAGTSLRLGTRGSVLATTQSKHVAAQLESVAGLRCELELIRTEGDVNAGPLATIGGTGVFVTAIRQALLAGTVDLIVHSYKDLPTATAAGIRLAAVPVREDPFDALCARDGLLLAELPTGASVGTGSPRRLAQLLRLRPDLDVRAIRGNVDSRLRQVSGGTLDAVVLARAGLARLGRLDAITETFHPDQFLPAPSQGALAIECRDENAWYSAGLCLLDDPVSRAAAAAERAFLATLQAGCSAPVGALATVDRGELTLTGSVIAVDGSREIRSARRGQVVDAAAIGEELGREVLIHGAAALLGGILVSEPWRANNGQHEVNPRGTSGETS